MKILPDNDRKLNDLLFENRNQAYGAYALRKDQDKRTLLGFLFSLTIFGIAALGMHFFKGGPSLSDLPLLGNNDKIDTLIRVDIYNPPVDPPAGDPTITTKVKTDPGTNYMAATKDADSIRTVLDAKNLVIGPPADTSGKVGIGKGPFTVIQPDPVDTTTYDGNTVAIMPEFEGNFLGFLRDKTVYPQLAKENGIEGIVYMNFVIDQLGNVTNVKILNPKANDLLKKESMRVFGKIPKWKPASDGKRNVKVSMTVPMRYSLK